MEINRNNYEAYFIDYLEGTLDEGLVDLFIEFITLNPDLKEELELFESLTAVPETISFKKKKILFKEKYDSEEEFNTAAMACLEGDFSKEEKTEFETYLQQHPEKRKEAALFSQTRLWPDKSITFNKKNNLYRRSLGKTILLWSGRVAAVLVFAFSLFSLLDKTSDEIPMANKLAEVDNHKVKIEKSIPPIQKSDGIEQKKEDLLKTKETIQKAPIKKVTPDTRSGKSIQESFAEGLPPGKEKIENQDITIDRAFMEIPAEMKAITASLDVRPPKAIMATMYISFPDEYNENGLLASRVKEKINFGKITKAGLNLVTSISNDRFTYQTGENGKVTAYNYDSRLLAFSLPGKKIQTE